MEKWIDIKGPVVGCTVYDEGKLVAKDVTINLPAVTHVTADFKAMGTVSKPIPGQIEAMETSIAKIGTDYGLRNLVKLKAKTLEVRFVHDVQKADGTSEVEGCKAFLRVTPKGIPGISIEPGSAAENELTFATTRYQLFVGGDEYWLIDQLNQIMRIGGEDYCKEIRSLL